MSEFKEKPVFHKQKKESIAEKLNIKMLKFKKEKMKI
jgi:hypothetical protein